MHKVLFLVLLGLLLLFQYQLRYGSGGNTDNANLQIAITKHRQLNSVLQERNTTLMMNIASLKGSSEALEARSRKEFNLIRPGEVLVLLPGNDMVLPKK
jgi:cell division protein FtsB